MRYTPEERAVRRARDGFLARDCLAHRPQSWDHLIAHFERPLAYYIAQMVGAQHRADVLQDLWLSAYASISTLSNPEDLRPWLYRLAHRRCIDALRKQGKQEAILTATETPHTSAREPQELPLDTDVRQLHNAVLALEPLYRSVVVLFYFEELSINQVAQALELPPGTVKSRIHHARKQLRNKLKNR